MNDIVERLKTVAAYPLSIAAKAAVREIVGLVEKLPQDLKGYRYAPSKSGKFDLWCVWMSCSDHGKWAVSRCRWCGYPRNPDDYEFEIEDADSDEAYFIKGPWVNKADAEAAIAALVLNVRTRTRVKENER